MKSGVQLLILGMVLASGTANGQISAPPTKAPDPTPEFVMPPPAPANPMPTPNSRTTPPPAPDLPPTPPLRGEDGKLIPLTEPLFWQATRHNAMMNPTALAQARAFFDRRLRKYEKIVTDNADLMRQINQGVIDKSNLAPIRDANNKDATRREVVQGKDGEMSLSSLMTILKPLVGDNVRNEIQTAGIMTRMQAQQNNKVMQRWAAELAADYEKTLTPLPANATKEERDARTQATSKERMRQQLTLWIDEATFAYGNLLHDAAANLDELLKKAGADAGAVSAEIASVKAASDRAGKIDAMKALVMKLPIEQERAILAAVYESRPELPPEAEPTAQPAEQGEPASSK
jgi:hypothetical protein